MSLDVHLLGPEETREESCHCCGHTRTVAERVRYFDGNITHNLCRMAEAAGIYKALWRPEECGIEKASQLIEPLRNGLAFLTSHPHVCKKHSPENGWGTYEGWVNFVRSYLDACEQHPDATVEALR